MSDALLEITFRDYLADPAISSTELRQAGRSREHFEYARSRSEHKDTPALRAGRLMHCLVLTPDLFAKEYAVCAVASRNTQRYEEMAVEFPKHEIVLQHELENATLVANAIRKNPRAKQVLCDAPFRERSVFWEHEGQRYKARPDALVPTADSEGWALCDLKTARSAAARRGPTGERAFRDLCADHGYPIQLALYEEGVQAATGKPVRAWIIVAVEKEPPTLTRVYELGAGWKEYGRRELARLREIAFNTDAANDLHQLPMPGWLETSL